VGAIVHYLRIIVDHLRCAGVVLAAVACALSFAPDARALDPTRLVSQYGHTTWTLQDAGLNGAPTSIAQTTDGYLWIGSRSGMVRFDGARFVPFTPPAGEKLRSTRILALQAARDGSLWIGSRSGLQQWKDGHLKDYPDATDAVMALVEDRDGKIWFARGHVTDRVGPLCEVVLDHVRCYGPESGLTMKIAKDLKTDARGNLWMNSDGAVAQWHDGSAVERAAPGLTANSDIDTLEQVAPAADGSVWVAASQPSRGMGLLRLVGDKFEPYVTADFDGRKLPLGGVYLDRENALWICTQNDGLYRLYRDKVSHYGVSDGLSSNTIQNLLEDREGTMWIVTTQGVEAFRDVVVANVSSRQGLPADLVNAVLAARDGSIWINDWHSLEILRSGKLTSINPHNGLPGEQVRSLFEDREGRMWVGVDDQVTRYEHDRFTVMKRRDGSNVGSIQGIAQDTNGDIWVVTHREKGYSLSRIHDQLVVEDISQTDVPFAAAHALVADPQQGIWVGMKNGDLGHYRNGQFETIAFNRPPPTGLIWDLITLSDGTVIGATSTGIIARHDGRSFTLTQNQGLPCNQINSLVMDRHDALWLYSECGIVSIDREQLNQWWTRPGAHVAVHIIDSSDGAQPALAALYPPAAAAPDGKLWFANASVVQVVDPDHLARNSVIPPVHIEQVVADRVPYSATASLHLPPKTRDLEIDYTALSLVQPRKVDFRYRLDGHDAQWQEAGSRRQAFYTNVDAGNYTFRVIASNNDGVWNNTGASMAIVIPPMFYQTRSFQTLCVFVGIALLYLLFTLRLNQLKQRMRERHEARLAERERIARELHDTFLQSVQGLLLRFQTAMERIPKSEAARGLMEDALGRADNVIIEGRNRVADLRESTRATRDLPQTLQTLGRDLSGLHSVAFTLTVEGEVRDMHPVVNEEVVAIGIEAVTNAFQHARATRIDVGLTYARTSLSLRIVDNGQGFDVTTVPDRHWGLKGMHERANRIRAHLDVSSRPDAGTAVELVVPSGIAFRRVSRARRGWFARRLQS
jgi:ligand-binding sensor domain-containing protein/signal transduction histidine kinase